MSGTNAQPKSAQMMQGCGNTGNSVLVFAQEGDPELFPCSSAPAVQTDTGSNPPNPKYGNWSNKSLF